MKKRKKKEKKLDRVFQIRISADMQERMNEVGVGTGMSKSQFVREAINDKLEAPDLHKRVIEIEKQLKQERKNQKTKDR